MVSSWSTKRRFIYGGSVILVLVLFFGGIFWKIIYHAPTCNDGKQNGDEKGIDCGGSCKNLCTSDALTPVVLWSKVFHISGDVYTAVAYIQNPNINSKNPNATYQFNIYDANNKLIISKENQTSIPKNKKFVVFETGLVFKNSVPKSADFKFLTFSPWQKDTEKDPEVIINYGPLISATTSPRIVGTISNASLMTIPEIELDILVLDSKENVVAASRSFVDNLLKGDTQDFVFTWPKPFDLGVEACAISSDIDLLLDKSSSMRSEGNNPPEPFTTVINNARDFVNNLTQLDYVAVTSFGTNSKRESTLSSDKNLALNAINSLSLSTTTEQTNITEGLANAWQELTWLEGTVDNKSVIVLLTDGVPTLPVQSGIPNYPISSAQVVAQKIMASGIEIYTIGLGKNVSGDFLKSISTDDNHYFFAPTKDTLSSIYSKIGTTLCPKKPNVITVIYRFL